MSKALSLNDIDADDDLLETEDNTEVEELSQIDRPYDPRLIRVEPKMFSLRNIMDMIEDAEVDLAPDFQRLRVWTPRQKSRLIESILLRIPLPAFYFASDEEGTLQVVDGVQRLSTIFEFVRTEKSFPLVDLEYLGDELGSKRFKEISGSLWTKRINNTQIVANVIDPQTPLEVKFDIFKRINTGGTPLNSQEIRHCMSDDPSRSLLLKLTKTEEFSLATGGKLAGHVRMADREMVLRVLAFSLYGLDEFLQHPSLDNFLNEATSNLDRELTGLRAVQIEKRFCRAMRLAYDIFEKYAFRKWPEDEDKRYPINRAIFESLGTVLYLADDSDIRSHNDIVADFRLHCAQDREFIASITQSTSAPRNVFNRYHTIKNLVMK